MRIFSRLLCKDGSKLSWKYLSQFHKSPPSFNLGREKSVQVAYIKFNAKGNGLVNFQNELFSDNKTKLWEVIDNEFPYNVDEYIKHDILWFNPNMYHQVSQIIANEKKLDNVMSQAFNNKDMIYFRHYSLFPSVINYHVFTKKLPSYKDDIE